MNGYLHMTETTGAMILGFSWHCRCGAGGGGFKTREQARKAGDRHLLVANRSDAPAPQ